MSTSGNHSGIGMDSKKIHKPTQSRFPAIRPRFESDLPKSSACISTYTSFKWDQIKRNAGSAGRFTVLPLLLDNFVNSSFICATVNIKQFNMKM